MKLQSGQTLFEVLLGIGLLSIIASLGLAVFISALRSSRASGEVAQAARFIEEELERVRVAVQASWVDFYGLAKGADYFVTASGTSQRVVQGTEGVLGDDVVNGLVAMWRFDEAAGVVAYDATSNNNSGTFSGAPARLAGSACRIAGCLGLDGSDDYVNVVDSPSLNPGSAITISSWVKANSTGSKTIVSKPAGGSWVLPYATYALRAVLNPGNCSNSVTVSVGTFIFEFWTQAWSGRNVCADLALSTGTWYHVAATYDGSVEKIYVDGALKSSLSVSGNIASSTQALVIGNRGSGGSAGDFFDGNIDDLRLYNRALSASEVASLYQSKVYTRKFTLSNVSRSPSGDIVDSGGTNDPSTQKVTVSAAWEGGGQGLVIQAYLSRLRNEVLRQSDWSGGSGVEGPVSSTIGYATSSGVVTSQQGEITLPPI